MAINLIFRKLTTSTVTDITTSTKTDIMLQTSEKQLRAIKMFIAFAPDSRYDNSNIKPIGNVCCPNTMRSDKLWAHKKTFQCLGRSDYQCPQCEFMCQMRNIPFEEQTSSFFSKFGQGIYILKMKKSIHDVVGDVYCPIFRNEKSVYLSANKYSSFYYSKKWKVYYHVLSILFIVQKSTIMLFGGDRTHWFAKRKSRLRKKSQSPILMKFLCQSQSGILQLEPEKAKIIPFMAHSCRLPIGWYS